MNTRIFFNDQLKDYFTTEEHHYIDLSRINVFIGSNNSGKSRFLRSISVRNINYDTTTLPIERINEFIRKVSHESTQFKEVRSYSDVSPIFDEINRLAEIQFHNYTENIRDRFKYLLSREFPTNNRSLSDFQNLRDKLVSELRPLLDSFEKNKALEYRIYIPMTRGLRPIQVDHEGEFSHSRDNFSLRTINDYYKDIDSSIRPDEIFTGLNFYNSCKKLLLGDQSQRKMMKDFEDFIKEAFFPESKEFAIVPRITDDVVHILSDNIELPIHQLGDGIQSLILLLFPLFSNADKNVIAFIEEPETNMHPGMQRKFVEVLLSEKFKNFQFFITTHSNHFLDLTLDYQDDINVFRFQKNQDDGLSRFKIEKSSGFDRRTLEVLGVRNSSVFLTNATIWVEGITDRLYIKHFIELYINDKKVKRVYEDLHFSFVEYGGANITHWDFSEDGEGEEKIYVNNLCSRFFLIADNDGVDGNPNGTKAKRLEELRGILGERFYKLKCIEIENLLSSTTIKKTVDSLEKGNLELDFSNLESVPSYPYDRIGRLILEKVSNLHNQSRYKTESGTIREKVVFCKAAISQLKDFSDLGQEAQDLTQRIYNFILSQNR